MAWPIIGYQLFRDHSIGWKNSKCDNAKWLKGGEEWIIARETRPSENWCFTGSFRCWRMCLSDGAACHSSFLEFAMQNSRIFTNTHAQPTHMLKHYYHKLHFPRRTRNYNITGITKAYLRCRCMCFNICLLRLQPITSTSLKFPTQKRYGCINLPSSKFHSDGNCLRPPLQSLSDNSAE